MISSCDLVAERVALGEPLGELAEHAATCPRCRRIAALPGELAASHRTADPGLGFSARITAGAQHRLIVRRRQRRTVAAASVVAAAALVMIVVAREDDRSVAIDIPHLQLPASATDTTGIHDPWKDPADERIDPDVRALVHLAHVERTSRVSAHWARIDRPLAPYRALLRGVTP
jgi:hypothetical protein